MSSNRRIFTIGVFTSVLFLIIFWGTSIVHLATPLSHHDDIDLEYFIQENNLSKISSLDFRHLYDTRMFYPHKETLAFGHTGLGQSLMALPIYFITRNVIISVNIVILIIFFLAFLFSYLFAFHFSKNVSGSLLAGLIYAYSPYMMSSGMQFPPLTHFILPLFFRQLVRCVKNLFNGSRKSIRCSLLCYIIKI